MAAIGNNINQADVSLYLRGVKPSKEAPVMPLELLKSKIATDISNTDADGSSGAITADELQGEETAFLGAGGTKDQFTSFMKDALGVDTAKFEPKAFSFNPTKSVLSQANAPVPTPIPVKPPATQNAPTPVKNPVVTPNSTTTDTPKTFSYNDAPSKETNRSIESSHASIKKSGLTVVKVNSKHNVASVTSLKDIERIKGMQKMLGVKSDGYIGPQTLLALAEKYAKPGSIEAGFIKNFVTDLKLDEAFGDKKIAGKTMSELFKFKREDSSDGVVPKDEQPPKDDTVPPNPAPNGTTDIPVAGGTDPADTPTPAGVTSPTGTTNAPTPSTVTPNATTNPAVTPSTDAVAPTSPEVANRQEVRKALESANSYDDFLKVSEDGTKKGIDVISVIKDLDSSNSPSKSNINTWLSMTKSYRALSDSIVYNNKDEFYSQLGKIGNEVGGKNLGLLLKKYSSELDPISKLNLSNRLKSWADSETDIGKKAIFNKLASTI